MWPRIAPSRVSVTVYKLIWALTDGSHRSMLLGCINCDSQPAAVNFFRSLRARLMTGGGYRLLASQQTCRGSFSAVSKPIFATKYSFFSIFRDLQDLHTFAPLQTPKFCKFLRFFKTILRIQLDHLVDLEKCCKMSIWLQKSASIQPRTSLLKFDIAVLLPFHAPQAH